jgi:hypothetical protein
MTLDEILFSIFLLHFSDEYLAEFTFGINQTTGDKMGKLETVASKKAELLAGQDAVVEAVLGGTYDVGYSEGGAGAAPTGFTQSDLDHAVAVALEAAKVESDSALANALAAQKIMNDQALVDLQAKCDQVLADDQVADDKVLADLNAQHDVKLAEVSQALVDMTAKEQLQESAVAEVKAKIEQVQESFDKIKALFL